MIRAYLLIICTPKIKYQIVNYFKRLPNVINVDITYGPYDIVVESIFNNKDEIKEKFEQITNFDKSLSTFTLIRSEDI